MSKTPNTLNSISKASAAGVLLAAAAIGLFVLLYTLLGNAGVDQFPALVVSLCAPPGILALLIGIYLLVVAPQHSDQPRAPELDETAPIESD